MSVPLFVIDAFADRPFTGNPAAVCILESPKPEWWLLAVAAEMNLSETAFLLKRADGFDLRWFTPKVEVDLCGHATLASAHVLWQENMACGNEIRFATRSGVLVAKRASDSIIELDFPTIPETRADPPPGMIEALGIAPVYVGRNRFDYLVEIACEKELREMRPNFAQLATVAARGVIVTSRSSANDFDFVSRFFAPRAGIDEDPVTGSAHCCLAPFWQERLGKSTLRAYQASARGGILGVSVSGDRTILSGGAITVSRGELVAH